MFFLQTSISLKKKINTLHCNNSLPFSKLSYKLAKKKFKNMSFFYRQSLQKIQTTEIKHIFEEDVEYEHDDEHKIIFSWRIEEHDEEDETPFFCWRIDEKDEEDRVKPFMLED